MEHLTIGKNPNINKEDFKKNDNSSSSETLFELFETTEDIDNDKTKAIEIEKSISKSVDRLIDKAYKMYKINPAKKYYDFIVTLESAAKTLKA